MAQASSWASFLLEKSAGNARKGERQRKKKAREWERERKVKQRKRQRKRLAQKKGNTERGIEEENAKKKYTKKENENRKTQ